MTQLRTCLVALLLLSACLLRAQGYNALNGSAYTGSTAVFNNPAASVGSAYKWDLTLFSVQAKASTNSAYLDKLGLRFNGGLSSHFFHAAADLSFLNFLYRPDNKKAFNFNIRARTYVHLKTLPVNIEDTINSIHSLLITNRNTPFIQGFVTHTGWLEADLNYSQVLIENSDSKLTGGVTLQIMKGISGAYLKINKLSYLESKNISDTTYTFTEGNGAFGYSDNYDIKPGGSNNFIGEAKMNLGLSFGIEYLLYDAYTNTGAPNNNSNYAWKFGASLMDLGVNTFKPSVNSTQFRDPVNSIPDNVADAKLNQPVSLQALKDSLSTLFNSVSPITDNFSISNPTRLVINVDRNFGNNFYLNGDMSLNFFSSSSIQKLHSRELNLFTITPRWEKIGVGAYLPVQYNTQGQLWIGAAIKLGPLVMGVHSLGIFKKDPSINGGAYLVLSVHPFNTTHASTRFDCSRY